MAAYHCRHSVRSLVGNQTDSFVVLTLVSYQELHRETGVGAACSKDSREAVKGIKASDSGGTHTAPNPGELLPSGH